MQTATANAPGRSIQARPDSIGWAAPQAGSPFAFIGCSGLVLVRALSGPLFGFSDTWRLVINTSTTIITFLVVFLNYNTQNRDKGALQAKLDELIRAVVDASNTYIGIEHLTDEELRAILEEVEQNAHHLHQERRRQKAGETKSGQDGGDAALWAPVRKKPDPSSKSNAKA